MIGGGLMLSDELRHYGVKGMKWGVRRDIGRRARKAARLSDRIDEYNNKKTKLTVKSNVKKAKEKSSDRVDRKIRKVDTEIKRLKNLRNTTVKNLSPKDIEQGKRAVETQKELMSLLDTAFTVYWWSEFRRLNS